MENYSFTIVDNTSDDTSSNPIAGSNQPSQGTSGTESGGINAGKGIAKGLIFVDRFVEPFVDQIVTQQISTINLRTGASEQQQRIEFGYQIGKSIYGVVKNVAIGALTGGWVGVVAGLGLSAISSFINYENKAQQLNWQGQLEDVSLRGMTIRAGGYLPSYSGSRSGAQ